ncbi:hypothetical protein HY797_04240 [Candidatus Falkowbacteria bacterium]|nr:hypothetical protein [Candidatus Falkowbacteria bacterium]
MKTRKMITAIMLSSLVVVAMVSGCASSRMNVKEMFTAEKIIGEPEEISYYRFILPEILDVPDTALVNFNNRVWPSLSWRAVFRVKNEKGKYDLIKCLATRDSVDPRNYLKINIPANVQLKPDDQILVVDHEQKYIFNAQGEFISGDYESVDLNKAEGFLTKVKDLRKISLKKGTPEYESAVEFSKRLIGTELIKAAEKVKEELSLPLGVSLNEEQLGLVKEKGYDKMFKELLFDKWYLAFAWPLITPETVGGSLFVTKIIQIPTYWFREETGPGRLNRPLTAKDWYITNYWLAKRDLATLDDFFNGFKLEEYGAGKQKGFTEENLPTTSSGLEASHSSRLPDAVKAAIKGTPCESSETYEQYNKCAAEYNAAIK